MAKEHRQAEHIINVAAAELRTPIMPILTCGEILGSSMAGRSEEIEAIKRDSLRLQRVFASIPRGGAPASLQRSPELWAGVTE
jgi:hypothetical protein